MKSEHEELFRTPVAIPRSEITVDHQTPVMMIGSCFTENMGSFLQSAKFPVYINPTGIVYNPLSALRVLELLLNEKVYTASDLFEANGLWHSYDHHGSFSSPSQEECLHKINTALSEARTLFQKAPVLFLTFGTAWVYTLKENGRVVSNCHKQPEPLFERSLMKVEEIVEASISILEKLQKIFPSLRIVYTVSPIRHWKDGAHGNQISKATLLLAIEEINKKYPCTSYFPSYEILMDELRDYRFYADDMLHISEPATAYIWGKFCTTFMTEETKLLSKEITAIQKSLLHRPLNPGTTQHNQFRETLVRRIETFNRKYPQIDFSKDLADYLSYELINTTNAS